MNDKYFGRTVGKLQSILPIYAKLIYQKQYEIQNLCYFETQEHFRDVPQNTFLPLEKGQAWGGEYQNMWIKGDFKIPKFISKLFK